LAETHFDAFVENLAERKVIVGHIIDARYGDPAAASHRANRGAQRFDGADFSVQHVFRFVEQAPVTLEPNGINADVCAEAICHVADACTSSVSFFSAASRVSEFAVRRAVSRRYG
jgi:hypothetical protein